MIEIYDFDPCLTTKDIIREMHKQYRSDYSHCCTAHGTLCNCETVNTYTYSQKEFRLKWVDDTHALGIFATNKQGMVCSVWQLHGRERH